MTSVFPKCESYNELEDMISWFVQLIVSAPVNINANVRTVLLTAQEFGVEMILFNAVYLIVANHWLINALKIPALQSCRGPSSLRGPPPISLVGPPLISPHFPFQSFSNTSPYSHPILSSHLHHLPSNCPPQYPMPP